MEYRQLISNPVRELLNRLYPRRAPRSLHNTARTDALTGLLHRQAFCCAAVRRLAAGDSRAALLLLGADFFADLNDSYGRPVGEQVLLNIARILRENCRDEDLICRIGEDEFAVWVEDVDPDAASSLAQRLIAEVAASPMSTHGAIIEYTASCGIAHTSRSDNFHKLFAAARRALHLARQQGYNCVAPLPEAA